MNGIYSARKSSGFTRNGAAALLGVSLPTLDKKEADPQQNMTLGEFFTLYREFDEDAQGMMWGYLEGLRDGSKKISPAD